MLIPQVADILDQTFTNIIHDTVSKVHRDEKVARMRSAVVIARQKAEEEAQSNGKAANGQKPGDFGTGEGSDIKVETDGAVFDNGKVYLKGNPIQTTKDIMCPDCGLPRLLYPTVGAGSRPPPDPFRQYCQNQPFIRKPGHDVHGNPFATDKPNTKKKKQAPAAETPGSSPPTTDGSTKQTAPEKVSFPTVKCQNCPRYFVVGRLAQHLDRCMGYSGRQAGRNKNAADNAASPSNTNAGQPKRPLAEDDTPPTPTKKKKYNPKKPTGKKPPPSSKLKNGFTPDMAADAEAAGDGDAKGEANGDTNA